MTTMANPISEQPERTTGRSSSITPGTYWAWVGAHGGAGVTTLSQAIPGGVDLGRRLPVEEGLTDLPAVAVCRGNAGGLIVTRGRPPRAHAIPRLLGFV